MSVHWYIIDYDRYNDTQSITALSLAIKEYGKEVDVVTLGEYFERLAHVEKKYNNAVFFGPCSVTRDVNHKKNFWVPGTWHDRDKYKCSFYYTYVGKYLTQKKYVMMPLSEVFRRKHWLYDILSQDGKVFIRPDLGEKQFNGEVVHIDNFDHWQNNTMFGSYEEESMLAVVSAPVAIDKEYRLVILDGKVITGSTYRSSGYLSYETLDSQTDSVNILDFAEESIKKLFEYMPRIFVLDIAKEASGQYSVLEVGCINAAGLYACDLKKIVKAVSDVSEEEYKSISPS